MFYNDNYPEFKIFAYVNYELAIDWFTKYDLAGITIRVDELDENKVNYIHAQNKLVSCFSMYNKNDHKRALDLKVDIFQTDDIKGLVKIAN